MQAMSAEEPPKKRRGPWKKGQSGNPKGRKPEPKVYREVKGLTNFEFISGLQKYGRMTPGELTAAMQDPGLSCHDIIMADIVKRAVDGEFKSRAMLIDRVCGKLKDTDVVINVSDVDTKTLLERAKAAIQILEPQPVIEIEAAHED